MNKLLVWILLPLFLLVFTDTWSQNKRETKRAAKKAQLEMEFNAFKLLLESKSFHFEASLAHSADFPVVDLNTIFNYVDMDAGNAEASLSFYGRNYNAGMSENRGSIIFNGPVEDYRVIVNERKHNVKASFQIREQNLLYSCSLSVEANGYTSLSVASQFKSHISYTGTLYALPEKK